MVGDRFWDLAYLDKPRTSWFLPVIWMVLMFCLAVACMPAREIFPDAQTRVKPHVYNVNGQEFLEFKTRAGVCIKDLQTDQMVCFKEHWRTR
jgi:hypothetical protein